MLLRIRDGVDAHALRRHLLEEHHIGLISTSPTDLRVAFSCLELEQIAPLFDAIHAGVEHLRTRNNA